MRCLRENSQTASSIYWFHILVGGIYIYMNDLWWMIHYNNHISWTLPVINGWFIYTGWWYTYPAEKWWSQLGVMNFPTEWKVIKFHGSKPPTRYCIYIHIYSLGLHKRLWPILVISTSWDIPKTMITRHVYWWNHAPEGAYQMGPSMFDPPVGLLEDIRGTRGDVSPFLMAGR